MIQGLDERMRHADLKQKKDTTVALTVSHSQDCLETLVKAVTHDAVLL